MLRRVHSHDLLGKVQDADLQRALGQHLDGPAKTEQGVQRNVERLEGQIQRDPALLIGWPGLGDLLVDLVAEKRSGRILAGWRSNQGRSLQP